MGLKKKKNIMILTICMVTCFVLYQLYFFLTITSETAARRVISILDHKEIKAVVHIRSEADKYINENGFIRGVLPQHILKYRPDKNNNFKCLNSEQYIPFEYVNDDYCDCDNGTDEPSTNACKDSLFYCDHQYQRKIVEFNGVPSSRVNDGICDCCDGSDEFVFILNRQLLSQSNERHYRYYTNKCPNIC